MKLRIAEKLQQRQHNVKWNVHTPRSTPGTHDPAASCARLALCWWPRPRARCWPHRAPPAARTASADCIRSSGCCTSSLGHPSRSSGAVRSASGLAHLNPYFFSYSRCAHSCRSPVECKWADHSCRASIEYKYINQSCRGPVQSIAERISTPNQAAFSVHALLH